ncbi:MAG: lysophospholipid acyltransferase family protein [Acidobacteria bacterium]|nr:lysophospholipid acyltransferase family protein [Acidobacteriota bacterium]
MFWRIPLQLVLVPISTLVLGLAMILLCPLDPTRRLFHHLARLWSGILCGGFGVRVQLEGVENVDPQRAAIFVANHQSLLDPPVLFFAIPANVRVIAKRSLFLVPIFGQALWAAGIIFINRRDRRNAIASMNRAAARIRGGVSVLIFAEGTRSRDGCLLPMKKGAFVLAIEAGVPVQPVLVTGTRDLLPRGSFFPRPGTVQVTFLPAIATDGLTYDDRHQLLESTVRAMQERLETKPATSVEKVAP